MAVSLRNLKATVDTKTEHTDFSVTTNAAGTAALSYNNAGTFAYTPPDLTSIDSSTLTKPIALADNEKITFGDGDDLQIYHNGTQNIIAGTGATVIRGNWLHLQKSGSTENYLVAKADGAVELYYDNVKKFETTADGVAITGKITGLTNPTAAQDAATKAYVDANVSNTLTDLGITDGSSGQVLTTDGAGNFTFATPAASGISLTNLSVTTAAASGSGALTYNNTNGVFTFTPADTATTLTDLGITDGSSGQVLTTDGAGNFTFTTVSSGTSITIDDPSIYENLNGSTSSFTIASGHTAKSILVYYNGVCLVPTTDYTVSGTTCTLTFTPQSGSDIVIRYLPI